MKQDSSQLDKLGGGGGGAHIHILVFCTIISFESIVFYGLWIRIYEYVPPPNYRANYRARYLSAMKYSCMM